MSRARFVRRLVGPSTLASMLLASGVAHAQSTGAIDPRFQPWIGCWRPIDSGIGLDELDGEKQPTRACLVPSSTTAGTVDLMLFHRDSIMSRTTVPLPGQKVARRIDECDGIETSAWTPGNARLVLKAELTCARGVKRVETGLVTMNESGQWVQFQHLAVGKNEATTVARFRFEGDGAGPDGVNLGTLRSTRALRLASGGAVEIMDVIDLAKMVPASLAEGWLTELGPRLALDAKALLLLADGGVPPRVIDVMVALANPDKFQIGPAMTNGNGQSQGRAIAALRTDRSGGAATMRSRCQMFDDFCYGPGGMGAWGMGYRYGMLDPWGYGYFNPYRLGVGGWGYNALGPWGGYGFGGGWGNGVYYGGGPVVIVPSGSSGGGSSGSGEVRGRAVRGGGYTPSTPRDASSPGMYTPPSRSGGDGGSSVNAGSSGGGGGGERTAKPRGSGGV